MNKKILTQVNEEYHDFLNHCDKYKTDKSGNELTGDDFLELINLDEQDILDCGEENNPCEMCGSHGNLWFTTYRRKYIVKEW